MSQEIKLSWWQRWIVRVVAKRLVKQANKLGKDRLNRQFAYDIRQAIIGEIRELAEWARTKTPELTADDDLVQLAAWVMESDGLQTDVNLDLGTHRDVHAKWVKPEPRMGDAGVTGPHVP